MAGRKVLVVQGSPRKRGNSALLAGQVIEGAEEAGADVRSLYLHSMELRPCSGCDSCQESFEADCTIEDDMMPLYPVLRSLDALVVATPVYWYSVSGQTKLFLDRCTPLSLFTDGSRPGGSAYEVQSALEGKEVAFLLTFGDRAFYSGAANALRTLEDTFRCFGCEIVGELCASAKEPGEVAKDTAIMAEARALGLRVGAGPGG